jgi:glutathione S-transferase
VRVLYHFKMSPFSRRARLALAHKGLDCELRDARDNPEWRKEAAKSAALRTVPVLIDGDVTLGDSTAITRWLDAAYPSPTPIWPNAKDWPNVLRVTALVDVALDNIINVGTRFYSLRGDATWHGVTREFIGRAQDALTELGEMAKGRVGSTITGAPWCAADMWLYSAVYWLEGLPARVATAPNAAQIMAVGGWKVPEPASQWAAAMSTRDDVKSL